MQAQMQEKPSEENKIARQIQQAWRERWSEAQWSVGIKSILPPGASGDAYNLTECLLEQALIGTTANSLILLYLKNSLHTHLISDAAILRGISRYEHFERLYSVEGLLDFVQSILPGVTCREKTEQNILPNAIVQFIIWIMKLLLSIINADEKKLEEFNAEYVTVMEKCCTLLKAFSEMEYVMAVFYVARYLDASVHSKMQNTYSMLENSLTNSHFPNPVIEKCLQKIIKGELKHLRFVTMNPCIPEITYSMQPILSMDVLLRPYKPIAYFVSKLQMLRRLNKFSNARLFYEFIRAALLPLSNANETNYDSIWAAFVFFKIPKIIKEFHTINPTVKIEEDQKELPMEYINDVVDALEMLIDDNILLDFLDVKCSCNSIEFLLKEWSKQKLVNEMHVKHFANQRESSSSLLSSLQTPSIVNFIVRAEVSFSGVLKTLSADYNKVQEALLGVLCQVLVGNSFELISSIAMVEERLTHFVQRLIHCNESSKQVSGEMGKASVTRSILFDVSFLMLTSLVQTYGAEVVLPEVGDSFFEKWVHEYLPDHRQTKNARNMLAQYDENIVDELLLILTAKPEAQLKNCNISWQDICINLPRVLYNALIAWEKEAMSNADIQNLLENIKRRLCCFSVCAAAFICSYVRSAGETERIKPVNMIQQFLMPLNADDITNQDNYKERSVLLYQIIQKIRSDTQSGPEIMVHGHTLTENIYVHSTIDQQFNGLWEKCTEQGWLSNTNCLAIDSLVKIGGYSSLSRCLIQKLLKYPYLQEMAVAKEFIFGIMHMNIESYTNILLNEIIPEILQSENNEIMEPHLQILADLCVKCIISTMELHSSLNMDHLRKKRRHSVDTDDSLDPGSKSMTDGSETELPHSIEESLKGLFDRFKFYLDRREITMKITFIYNFVNFLLDYENSRILLPVMRLLQTKLCDNILQLQPAHKVGVGFIIRMHDLNANPQAAINDLTLWRNHQINLQYKRLC